MAIAVGDSKLTHLNVAAASMNFAAGDCLVVIQSWDGSTGSSASDNNGNSYTTPTYTYTGLNNTAMKVWVFPNQAANAALVVTPSGASIGFTTVVLKITQATTSALDVDTPNGNYTLSGVAHTTTTAGTIDQPAGMTIAALAPLSFGVDNWTASGYTVTQEEADNGTYYGLTVFTQVSSSLSGTNSITSVPTGAADTSQLIFVLKESGGVIDVLDGARVGVRGPKFRRRVRRNEGSTDTAQADVTAALTGVQATGGVGTVSVAVSTALTGNQATGQVGNVTPTISNPLTGNQATGGVGNLTVVIDKALLGNAATGQTGNVTPAIDKALSGNAATGQVGSVSPSISDPLTGNSGTGQVGNVGVNVTVALTGVQATGQTGNVTPVTGFSVPLTGNQATGAAGNVSVAVDKALTGNSASGQVGNVSPAVSKALTGNAASGQVGNVGVDVTVALTGVQATGQTGTVTPSQSGGPVNVPITGVQGTGQVGNVGVSVDKALTGVQGTGQTGIVTPATDKALTGNQAASQIGNVGVSVTIGLTGVQATGQVGNVTPVSGVILALSGVQSTGQVGNLGVAVQAAVTGVQATGQVGNVSLPPITTPGGSGLRRWLIQQYTEYFEARDQKAKEKAVPVPPPQKAQKHVKVSQDLPQVTSESDFEAAYRIADQLLSARSATAARLEFLEKLVVAPRATIKGVAVEQADDEDEDLLLLADIF